MAHFSNITSFAELKKQYRTLAIANHPDKGGDTQTMQEINAEFDKLYKIWEHRKDEVTSRTGYESDYDGATSTQYQEYVYNEYSWRGSRYKGQCNTEILDTLRAWLKDTYPRLKFSVRISHYSSFFINLITADFEVFTEESKDLVNCSVNHYHIDSDKRLTERAKEVMTNVNDYIMSYNYDNSDPYTDYFCTNFYLTLGIGRHDKPFEMVIPQLACPKGKEAPTFKFPEGKAHKAIRLALNGSLFDDQAFRDGTTRKVLGDTHYYSNKASFSPKHYSAPKTAQKRLAKLQAAGMICHLWGSYIVLEGYTPETLKALDAEVFAEKIAKDRWEEEQRKPKAAKATKATKPKAKKTEKVEADAEVDVVVDSSSLTLIDYTEKAFAIVGDTKPIKELLKKLGGKFNPMLTCGAGWVFPKTKIDAIKEALSIAA